MLFFIQTACFSCSQYIAEFLPIFETIPMKFGDEEQEISDFWREYYIELGLPVPLNTKLGPILVSWQHRLLQCKERNLHDSDF